MDDRLRELQRRVAEVPDDKTALFVYRSECVRLGRFDLCSIMVGDTVIVDEVESPWINGTWEGTILKVFEAQDKYVHPINLTNINWRVKPSPEYLAKGLYLTRQDKTTCKEPALPKERV